MEFEDLLPLIDDPLFPSIGDHATPDLPPESPTPTIPAHHVLTVTFLHSHDALGMPLFGIRHLDPLTHTSLYFGRCAVFRSELFRAMADKERATAFAPGKELAGALSDRGPHAVMRFCQPGQHGVDVPGFYIITFGIKQADGTFAPPLTPLEIMTPFELPFHGGMWKQVPFRHGAALLIGDGLQARIGDFTLTFSVALK